MHFVSLLVAAIFMVMVHNSIPVFHVNVANLDAKHFLNLLICPSQLYTRAPMVPRFELRAQELARVVVIWNISPAQEPVGAFIIFFLYIHMLFLWLTISVCFLALTRQFILQWSFGLWILVHRLLNGRDFERLIALKLGRSFPSIVYLFVLVSIRPPCPVIGG